MSEKVLIGPEKFPPIVTMPPPDWCNSELKEEIIEAQEHYKVLSKTIFDLHLAKANCYPPSEKWGWVNKHLEDMSPWEKLQYYKFNHVETRRSLEFYWDSMKREK